MENLYYVAPDFSIVIPEHCPDETYIYVEAEMDSELAETTPIEAYGSDRDLAGWTAYNIASNVPVTVEALEALQAALEKLANDDPHWVYPASLVYASSVKATIKAIAEYEAENA